MGSWARFRQSGYLYVVIIGAASVYLSAWAVEKTGKLPSAEQDLRFRLFWAIWLSAAGTALVAGRRPRPSARALPGTGADGIHDEVRPQIRSLSGGPGALLAAVPAIVATVISCDHLGFPGRKVSHPPSIMGAWRIPT